MENIVLSIHLILALSLIAVVLLQRSEGGGLGMGGGGGAVSTRSTANVLTKLTWILAIGFLVTSLSLTIIAANKAGNSSVLDTVETLVIEETTDPSIPSLGGSGSLVPEIGTDAPAVPPASE